MSSVLKSTQWRNYNLITNTRTYPAERNYRLQLTEKIELLIKGMRWKAHFYNEKKDAKENETHRIPDSYGFNSLNCPRQVRELIQFESDLLDIMKSLKFGKKEAISKIY